MAHCPFDFFTDGKKHNICLVGGGGKTTVMYELAAAWAACGRKGLVLTCKERLLPYYAQFGFRDEGVSDKSTHGNVVWHQMRLTF